MTASGAIFRRRRASIGFGALALLLGAGASGCAWVALGLHSLTYRTTRPGESANVVIDGTTAYGSLAEKGFEVVDLTKARRRRIVPPPPGSGTVDDLAVADGLLFVLGARPPGHLAVFSLVDPAAPALTTAPIPVSVGPFSGVSAGGGKVAVSGGTSELALYAYAPDGRLSPRIATADLGRGQPDVLLAPNGRTAYVSTHYSGPHFGLTTLEIGAKTLVRGGRVDLDTYGFTPGGAKPASFPVEAALAGDVVLVAHLRGLAVVSVERPGDPRLLRVVELGLKAVNVDVAGNAAAVVGSSPKPLLVLLDVTKPSAPVVKRSLALPEGSYPTSVAITADHVVVAAHGKGLLVFQRREWSLRPERITP